MTSPHALNTHNPQKWAAVVSGTSWKRWGVSEAGTLEAEYIRGPLIIWATPKPGEGEDAPQVQAPKPDALALRVLELNTRAQFERFRKAACKGVSFGYRWSIYCPTVFHGGFFGDRFYYLVGISALDWDIYRVWDALKSGGNRKGMTREDIFCGGGGMKAEYLQEVYKLGAGALDFMLAALKPVSLASLLLRALQAAEYRAHALKRVKPAPRRGRIPRPAHAVPRPPCAPCAPPAA